MKQESLSLMGYYYKGKKTKREQFLAGMDSAVPWKQLCALIEPHYPRASKAGGRPAIPLERMLRIYCLQQWYNLSDPGAEEALYDSLTMRSFAGITCDADVIPDETTILRFRRLLEKHDLTAQMLTAVNTMLADKGLLLGKGTIVDATIIHAPSSTKNEKKERDPEMHQTCKGKQYYFGMKVHTGVDARSGLVHTVVSTPANVADIQVMGELMHGQEDALYADSAYQAKDARKMAVDAGIKFKVCERAGSGRPLTQKQRMSNRRISKIRAIGEHPFLVVKRLWGHAKVRYRGLMKNQVQMLGLFALANIFRVRTVLLSP